MHFETDYKLENFILDIKWKKLPLNVRKRLIGCFVDLNKKRRRHYGLL